MHPLRTLWELSNIDHWRPLIKNQDTYNRYIESHPPFYGKKTK